MWHSRPARNHRENLENKKDWATNGGKNWRITEGVKRERPTIGGNEGKEVSRNVTSKLLSEG